MFRKLAYLAALLAALSCASARYARGPESSEIESIPGYDGKICTVTFDSSEPRLSERRMVVYLPPSYSTDTLRRYPVFYLIHGARGNETTWIDRGEAFRCLDSLRRCGLAPDFILVLPNINTYWNDKDYNNGHAVDPTRAFWLTDGEAERYFMQDVVSNVDKRFRTDTEKNGRAIAGMSIGALQALHIAANYPDSFGYIGLFSPYTRPTFAALGHMDVYGRYHRKLARQFSDPPSEYRIYIGTKDIFYPHIRSYDAMLRRKGYPHEFIVSEGGHTWISWRAYLTDFYQHIFD